MIHWRTNEDKYEGWSEGRRQCGTREKFRVQVIENLEFFSPKPILEDFVELNWEWDDHIGFLERDPWQ